MLYVCTQNDNPIPNAVHSDFVQAVAAAEAWAEYSKRRVHVIELDRDAVVKMVVLPKPKELQ